MDDRTRPSSPADGATTYAETAPFQAAKPEPLLNRAIPVSAELPRYRAPSARRDVVAGVTVAALAVPAAMAYAEVAGVSPVNGLYALLLPTVAYVLLGSSRQLIVGPEGSISTLVGAAVLPLAVPASHNAAELAAMLALLVAACFALAWVLRLGWIADYFSRPVLLGYIHGVAVVLIIGQLGKLVGLSVDARDPLPQLWEVLHDLNNISGTTVVLAAAALAALFALRVFMPKTPAALVVVVVAIGLSWVLDLQAHGVAVGAIPAGLPSFAVPRPAWRDVIQLLPAAVGVFLVSFADEILTARSFAGKHNQHVRAPQELLAMGTANAAAGFTQGFSVGASGSRTAVNDSMGARSQVANLIAAALCFFTLILLTSLFRNMPQPALAAIVIAAMLHLTKPKYFQDLFARSRESFATAMIVIAGELTLGVLEGIALGVALSLLILIYRTSHPHVAALGQLPDTEAYRNVERHPEAIAFPGLLIWRIGGDLFFASVGHVSEALKASLAARPDVKRVLLDFGPVNFMDISASDELLSLIKKLQSQGVTLAFARVRDVVRDDMRLAGIEAIVGPTNFHERITDGVRAL